MPTSLENKLTEFFIKIPKEEFKEADAVTHRMVVQLPPEKYISIAEIVNRFLPPGCGMRLPMFNCLLRKDGVLVVEDKWLTTEKTMTAPSEPTEVAKTIAPPKMATRHVAAGVNDLLRGTRVMAVLFSALSFYGTAAIGIAFFAILIYYQPLIGAIIFVLWLIGFALRPRARTR